MFRTLVALAASLFAAGCYFGPVADGGHPTQIPECADSTCDYDVDLGSGTVEVSGSTLGRYDTLGVGCGEGGSGPDLAYRWVAPADGAYLVSLDGADFEALLAVRAQTSTGAELACLDLDSGANAVSLTLAARQAVVIVVDGAYGDAGHFRLSVSRTGPVCGDGSCGAGESCSSCPADCGRCAFCGDGACNGVESCSSCATDCGRCSWCGDGACNAGESCSTCSADCGACSFCGDGTCNAGEDATLCPADCGSTSACGDGFCDYDEDGWVCPEDCDVCQGYCGDGYCGGGEDGWNCAWDCAASCGDGVCGWDEDASTCATDCTAYCGDGICDPVEDGASCAADCTYGCGDGYCDWNEDGWNCAWDCGVVCPG